MVSNHEQTHVSEASTLAGLPRWRLNVLVRTARLVLLPPDHPEQLVPELSGGAVSAASYASMTGLSQTRSAPAGRTTRVRLRTFQPAYASAATKTMA